MAAPPGGLTAVIVGIAHIPLVLIAVPTSCSARLAGALGHPAAKSIFWAFRYPVKPVNKNKTRKYFLRTDVLTSNSFFM
jgi:hypothetical protein